MNNAREAIITVTGEYEDTRGCLDLYTYYVSLYESQEAHDDYDDAHVTSGSRKWDEIRDALDTAYIQGFRRAVIRDYDTEAERHVRIGDSPRRRGLLAAHEETERNRKRVNRNFRWRQRRWHRLAERLREPDSQSISRLFRNWKRVTGYGPGRDGSLRDLLAPAKAALVNAVVIHAQRDGWQLGIAQDSLVRNGYSRVVYIDMPLGQVSFHVRPTEYEHLPVYQGEWSGDSGATARILTQLYAQ